MFVKSRSGHPTFLYREFSWDNRPDVCFVLSLTASLGNGSSIKPCTVSIVHLSRKLLNHNVLGLFFK